MAHNPTLKLELCTSSCPDGVVTGEARGLLPVPPRLVGGHIIVVDRGKYSEAGKKRRILS